MWICTRHFECARLASSTTRGSSCPDNSILYPRPKLAIQRSLTQSFDLFALHLFEIKLVTRDPQQGGRQSQDNHTWRRTCEPPLPPPAHTTTFVNPYHKLTQLLQTLRKHNANTPCQHHDQHVNSIISDSDLPLCHTRGPTQPVLQTVPKKPIQSIRPPVPPLPRGLERVHQELLQIAPQQKSSREGNQGPQ